ARDTEPGGNAARSRRAQPPDHSRGPTLTPQRSADGRRGPAARCPEGTLAPSPESARCGLTGCLAAPILAGRGLASLSICHRWLPSWLPSWLPAIRQTSTRVPKARALSSGASASLADCDTWATKLVTIRGPTAATPAETGLP